MLRITPSYLKNNKAVALLLAVFFILAGTCSVQKIVLGSSFELHESAKQPKSTFNSGGESLLNCSLKSETVEASFINSSSTDNQLASSLLFFTVLFGICITFFEEQKTALQTGGIDNLVSPLPLFLKYRTLII